MIVFRILKNGKEICQAGRSDLSVLSGCITAVGVLGSKSTGCAAQPEGIKLAFDATGRGSGAHQTWLSDLKVVIGDQISIDIIESEAADTPIEPPTLSEEELTQREQQKAINRKRAYEQAKKTYFDLKGEFEPEG